jgi:hypothetical protein
MSFLNWIQNKLLCLNKIIYETALCTQDFLAKYKVKYILYFFMKLKTFFMDFFYDVWYIG